MDKELLDCIVETVAKVYDLDKDAIFSKQRTAEICDARHAAMYLLFNYTKLNYSEIGRYIRRSHVAVKYGVTLYAERLKHEYEKELIRKHESIMEQLLKEEII